MTCEPAQKRQRAPPYENARHQTELLARASCTALRSRSIARASLHRKNKSLLASEGFCHETKDQALFTGGVPAPELSRMDDPPRSFLVPFPDRNAARLTFFKRAHMRLIWRSAEPLHLPSCG